MKPESVCQCKEGQFLNRKCLAQKSSYVPVVYGIADRRAIVMFN